MTHLDDAQLRQLADGTLPEHLVLAVVAHVDDCPRCRARADGFDPCADTLARLPAPAVPDDLVRAVLARDVVSRRLPWAELTSGSALLVLAGALTLGLPGGQGAASAIRVAVTGISAATRGLEPPTLAWSLVAVSLVAIAIALTGSGVSRARRSGW